VPERPGHRDCTHNPSPLVHVPRQPARPPLLLFPGPALNKAKRRSTPPNVSEERVIDDHSFRGMQPDASRALPPQTR
ncbi:hypothetical protein BaRGS_00030323, partial [Batillaria attramentaria]